MMRTPIVMLMGKGRSGKGTAAEVLCEHLNGAIVSLADPIKRFFLRAGLTVEQLWGSQKQSRIVCPDFNAAHLKFWLSEALGGWRTPVELMRIDFRAWVDAQPKDTTPRHLMQTFGTECVRQFSPDMWVDFGLCVSFELLAGRQSYDRQTGLKAKSGAWTPDMVAIDDGRFRNEGLRVKEINGHLMHLVRPDVQDGFTETQRKHASEREQDSIPEWWYDGTIVNDKTLEQFEQQVANLAQWTYARPQ